MATIDRHDRQLILWLNNLAAATRRQFELAGAEEAKAVYLALLHLDLNDLDRAVDQAMRRAAA